MWGFLLVVSHHVCTCKEPTCLKECVPQYPQFSWTVIKHLVHKLNCLTWGSFSFLFLGWYIILRLGTFNLDNIIAWVKTQSGRPTRSTTEGNFEELAEQTTSSPETHFFRDEMTSHSAGRGFALYLCWTLSEGRRGKHRAGGIFPGKSSCRVIWRPRLTNLLVLK